MKNILIATFVLILSITLFSSCKKAYKCKCDGQISNAYTEKFNKSDAAIEKEKCEATTGCTFERDK